MNTPWTERVRELTHMLVRWPSVLDTPDEAAFAPRLHSFLAAWPYFREHPEHLFLLPTHDDDRERWNLIAMVRGSGSAAVALTGHYDTVPIADYGALAPLAIDPEALLPALSEALRRENRPEDQLAIADLARGAFLPGRGALDMKSGLAIGLALLERFAAQPDRGGSLLFIATPDEEGASIGMRSLVADLPAWLAAHGLSLEAAINLDVSSDQGDGSAGQAVFLGSVGKLLAAVMLVGRPAHLGAPFEGISANLLAAELVRTVDYNPALCDRNGAELGTPPITLRLQDAKTSYDVSTPQFTWCAINLLSYRRGPQETLDLLCTVAAEALASALAIHHARACAYAQQAGRPDPAPLGAGRVYPIAELYDRVHRHGGEAALSAVAAMEAAALERHQGDAFAQLRVDQAVAEALWQSSGLQGPAAVIGFVGPHYPLVTLDATTPRGSRLQAAIERQVATITAETGVPIRMRPLFTGISDMSFLARPQAAIDRAALLANVAAASTRRRIAAALGETLDVPVVNIGPWGRDYHQRTERLYTPYAFTTLPELLWRVVGDLLAGTEN
jgi:arginine utilization protein RocB